MLTFLWHSLKTLDCLESLLISDDERKISPWRWGGIGSGAKMDLEFINIQSGSLLVALIMPNSVDTYQKPAGLVENVAISTKSQVFCHNPSAPAMIYLISHK